MWELANHTPFPARQGFDRDGEGRSHWVVWLKASFALGPDGRCRFTPDQKPLLQSIEPDEDRVPIGGCDVTLPRPHCEIALSGSIEPRSGSAHGVTLALGEWSRTIVFEREGRRSGRSDAGTPSIRLDGPRPSGEGGWRVGGGGAMGFGVVPPSHPMRQAHAGTYDENWRRTRMPVLPADFDPLHWQETAPDQWLSDRPDKGARLVLGGLGGSFGHDYSCELPWLELRLDTRFKGAWSSAIMEAQIVRVDADAAIVSTTYCAAMPILAAANDVKVERSVVTLEARSGFAVPVGDLEAYRALEGADA